MKPSAILAALAISFLVWLPRCEAALRAQSQKTSLLRRLRLKQEPFIVSFRVTIKDGLDNEELAKNLSARINTPHSPMAATLGYSVARVFNGTFPPVQWPPSTTFPAMKDPPTPAPSASVYAAATVLTTPRPNAIQTALEALRIARQNKADYEELTKRMTGATLAHANALAFGNPTGTTPIPTMEPRMVREKERALIPHTLGRLIYDAFVNTPAPMEMTTPMPTPAVPTVAVLSR